MKNVTDCICRDNTWRPDGKKGFLPVGVRACLLFAASVKQRTLQVNRACRAREERNESLVLFYLISKI